jgi:hypothetical protein
MKRPTPEQVVEIVSELGADSETVSMQALVRRIRELTNCSRATAYRGCRDAMALGVIRRSEA